MIYLDVYESPMGQLTLASDGTSLCGLWFGVQKHFAGHLELRAGAEECGDGAGRVTGAEARACAPVLDEACAWLDTYFAGRDPGATPPVVLRGTAFQEEVWAELTKIPYGELATYGAIAQALAARRAGGKRVSARAVGGAVGRNPVGIIVPCHRVIGANGTLTGYAAGVDRKRVLLALEGIDIQP